MKTVSKPCGWEVATIVLEAGWRLNYNFHSQFLMSYCLTHVLDGALYSGVADLGAQHLCLQESTTQKPSCKHLSVSKTIAGVVTSLSCFAVNTSVVLCPCHLVKARS